MEKFKSFANAIFQNAMVGSQSIRDIEDSVEDERLKKELSQEREKFNNIALKVKNYAENNGVNVDENNFFEKSRLWMSIKMTTMFDKSTRHIAEMMLLGTVMGLTTCYKDKFDHKGVDNGLEELLAELEETLDKNYLNLKSFLKGM